MRDFGICPYVLTADELRRRIRAARILRNVHQDDLQKSLAQDGLGRRELGRIERGELPLTKIRRGVLSNALRVPESWFLSESVDEIVGLSLPKERTVGAGDLRTALPGLPPTDADASRMPKAQDEPPNDEEEAG